MMRFKKYLILLCIVFLYLTGTAQNSGFYWTDLNESSNKLQGKLKGEIYYLSGFSNKNYFLQKDWELGSITLRDGVVFDDVKLRYLAFGDELIAYNKNLRALFIVDKSTVEKFSTKVYLNSELYNERKFVNLDSLKLAGGRSYFEELYDGSVKLLVYHYVEELKVSPYSDNMGITRDSEFRLAQTYYVKSDTKDLVKIQRKKRSILSLYPEHKKEIKKIFRSNRIILKDKQSMVQVFVLIDEAGLIN